MPRAARTLILILAVGPTWLAASAQADGMRSYDRVIDVGQQDNMRLFQYPQIEESGKVVEFKTQELYHIDATMDPLQFGHTLSYSMLKGLDPTNMLPALLSVPSDRLAVPNSAGHVTGFLSGTASDPIRPYFCAPETGQLTWLKSLPGAKGASQVYAINGMDQIVGTQGSKAIFYASPSSEPTELATLLPKDTGWNFLQATGINDRGEVVGYGYDPQGKPSIFKLMPSPVPEPSTLMVFVLSSFALIARNQTRRI